MNKPICSFIKGVGTGAVIGAAAAVTVCSMSGSNHKSTRKKISHAMKYVSDFIENASYMIK